MTPIRDILIIHHSHTDIGYTNYQSNVFARHREYFRRALDLAERYADNPEGERFKWTSETTILTEDFLRHASDVEADRLIALHRAGLIDFGGMYCNVTPLMNVDLLARTLSVAARMRQDYGLDIRYAMNCDVNGQSWGLVELLLDAGFEGFGMAINRVMARDPQPRPMGFRWMGPSGRSLLVWHGEHYGFGHTLGIPKVRTASGWTYDPEQAYPLTQAYLARLVERGYPYDFVMFQITSTFLWDNGGPHEELTRLAHDWNRRGWQPRIRLVGLAELYERLSAHRALETLEGDWTDWWAHGVASSAFETALNRQTHGRYFTAQALHAALHSQPGNDSYSAGDDDDTWRNLTLYNEHTWGSHNSILYPSSADARGQGYRKLIYAHDGAAAATRFWQRVQHDLAARLAPSDEPRVVVFNPLPWPRRAHLSLPEITPTGWENAQLEHYLELSSAQSDKATRVDYGIIDLPPCGYTTVPLRLEPPVAAEAMGDAEWMAQVAEPAFVPRPAPGLLPATSVCRDGWQLENRHYRLRLDSTTGAIASLISKDIDREWADLSSGWGLGNYVYETNRSPRGRRDMQLAFAGVPDHDRQPVLAPERHSPNAVSEIAFVPGMGHGRLSLRLDAPGATDVRLQVVLYDDLPWIDLIYDINKTPVTEAESVYVAFPFALQLPVPRYEVAGAIVQAEAQQLRYACRDFYAVQHWVDLSDERGGVTVAIPDAPIIHLGGFTNHKYLAAMQMQQPYLVSWPVNNHWFTNFQLSQQGWMRFRYRLLPHAGPFDPVAATRFGAEAAVEPLCGPVWDHPAGLEQRVFPFAPHLPDEASFLTVAPDHVHMVGLKPAADGDGIIIRLQELAGKPADYEIGFNLSRVLSAARCDLVERSLDSLTVTGQSVSGPIEPHRIETIRVRLAQSDQVGSPA